VAARELTVPAMEWWADVERRLADADITLYGRVERDAAVPSTLFDGFLENALENARAKREREPGIGIGVDFICTPGEMKLSVCDTGSPVPDGIAARLFEAPVERRNGMGIGLYHVSRQAAQSGYRAALDSNKQGCVCFTLARPDDSAAG
jgi:sensor histidine kinase regulating citrate/malate metabolism